jgi:hypothetical protein
MKVLNSICGVVALALVAATSSVSAATITLGDLNSSLAVNDQSGAIMDSWHVDGVSQLAEMDYYYRIGAAGPEANINTIPLVGAFSTDSNPFTDSQDDTVAMLYRSTGVVDIEVKISLLGGQAGSGWSDVTHQVKISNTGTDALDFHLFQYADFDLGGTAGDDTVEIFSPDEVLQSDGNWQVAISEIITPDASHWDTSISSALRDSLTDGITTVLDDDTGPVSGNVEYAFQWDVTLNPGDSFIVSKDMLIIPEPSSIALVGVVSALGLFVRRRFMA